MQSQVLHLGRDHENQQKGRENSISPCSCFPSDLSKGSQIMAACQRISLSGRCPNPLVRVNTSSRPCFGFNCLPKTVRVFHEPTFIVSCSWGRHITMCEVRTHNRLLLVQLYSSYVTTSIVVFKMGQLPMPLWARRWSTFLLWPNCFTTTSMCVIWPKTLFKSTWWETNVCKGNSSGQRFMGPMDLEGRQRILGRSGYLCCQEAV